MSIPEKFLTVTRLLPDIMNACPSCDVKGLVWKTRNADSPWLGDVYCSACQWTTTREDFLQNIWPDLKQQ